MISALKTRELNKNTLLLMEFYDGGQLFKRRVEGFHDVWIFDRLPYVDLTTFLSDVHGGFSDLYWEELITLFEEGKEDYFDQEYKMEYEIEYDEME
jgi:hypothetical protein